MKLSRWDRFLMALAPRWGVQRVQARAAAEVMARHYEAAGGGRRTSGWRKSGSDADAASGPHLANLRNLSRDLRRNNGWARRGIQTIANNTVGWGIQPKASGQESEAATDLWHRWADSIGCDFAGRLPFYGLQRLVMETVAESGEALVIRRVSDSGSGLPVPLQLEVFEPDIIDSSRDAFMAEDGGFTSQGIEFDKLGRRRAYWLFPRHPGGMATVKNGFRSSRVPAENVLHIYRTERPGQSRGAPWLASAIARLHDLDDYEDAVLMQAKIAACFAAFVQDMDGAGTPLNADQHNVELESLEPGMIAHLQPGKTITTAQPPSVQDQSFRSGNLRRIAVSLGVTYEDLTGDYSQVNFSSARMARLAHWANVHDWRWNMLIPQLCDQTWRWVMGAAVSVRILREVPGVEWSPPPMPMLEPEKEGLAYQRLIRSGAMTLYQAIRERGEDPETQLREIEAGNQRLDELKIILDSDPRHVSAAGLTQWRVGKEDIGGLDESSEGEA